MITILEKRVIGCYGGTMKCALAWGGTTGNIFLEGVDIKDK
jgi:hypothetical protein